MAKTYEYEIVTIMDVDDIQECVKNEKKVLNDMGKKGWKLINIKTWANEIYFYFMKEK